MRPYLIFVVTILCWAICLHNKNSAIFSSASDRKITNSPYYKHILLSLPSRLVSMFAKFEYATPSLSSKFSFLWIALSCSMVSPIQAIKVYWINIDSNTARRDYMEAEFASLGLSHHRISASVGTSLESLNISYLEKPCRRNTLKDLACTVSHLRAALTFVQSNDNDDYALIMEDDVQFLFDIDYDALIASAPKDFGVLQLVTSSAEALRRLRSTYQPTNPNTLWHPNHWNMTTRDGRFALFWSAQAYIINRNISRERLSYILDETYENPHFRLVNSFYPRKCSMTKDRPCFLSNCLFADTFVYSALGPTYVSTVPLFNGASIGLDSELHQEQVHVHKAGFEAIKDFTTDLIHKQAEGKVVLPPYIKKALRPDNTKVV